MIEKIKQWLVSGVVSTVVRKAINAAAVWLLAIGVEQSTVTSFSESATTVALAVASYAITELWSYAAKRAAAK